MKKLPYIEDYIALLADDPFLWPPRTPLIKLARYDEPIVNSMAYQINKNISFTDRQSVLAHKIVTKYRKQWSTAGYDVTDHIDSPKYKLPIRVVDRRKIIDVNHGLISIRFPYDQELISRVRAAVSDIPGRLQWDPESHSWTAALIEPRIIWAQEFGNLNGFEFGDEFRCCLEEILNTPDYSIKLVKDGDGFNITNAESSLIDYVRENIGFDKKDLIKLVDTSSILGYEVDDEIKQIIADQYGNKILDLMLTKCNNNSYTDRLDSFADLVAYAKLVGRQPIYVYESGSETLRKEILKYYTNDEVLSTGHHLIPVSEYSRYQVIYYSNWKAISHHIPLLVTLHTLTIGIRRQQASHLAEKIITYTHVANNE